MKLTDVENGNAAVQPSRKDLVDEVVGFLDLTLRHDDHVGVVEPDFPCRTGSLPALPSSMSTIVAIRHQFSSRRKMTTWCNLAPTLSFRPC